MNLHAASANLVSEFHLANLSRKFVLLIHFDVLAGFTLGFAMSGFQWIATNCKKQVLKSQKTVTGAKSPLFKGCD
jgi:hypothetical protein